MKKSNLFLVLLTALIVMSCSKDETTMGIPQEGNAIEFGTYVGRDAQTRATMINDLTALKGTGFGVFAYYTDNSDYTDTSKPNFMYNQLVSGTQVSGAGTVEDPYVYTWSYLPVKYWPNEYGSNNHQNNQDKLSFFAYAPYSTTTGNFAFTPANNAAGDPTITYTVNTTAKLQEDLLWGVDATGVATSNPNFGLPYINQQKQTTTGNIKFQFKHALARIGFNVQAMIDQVTGTTSEAIADNTDIVVTKVELIGKFYASGALNLNNTAANVPLWDGVPATPTEERTFVLSSAADNFVYEADFGEETKTHGQSVTVDPEQLNADDSYLMVIPQKFESGNEVKIRVTYDVITADDKLDTEQSKVKNVITSTPFVFDFVGGKAYTFNLHLGMTSVKFDATVSDWGTETGTVVNVPINTAP